MTSHATPITNRITPIVWIEMPAIVAVTASHRISPTAMSAMGGPTSAMGSSLSLLSPCVSRASRPLKPGLDACPMQSVVDSGALEPLRDGLRRVPVVLRARGHPQHVVGLLVDLVAPVREVDGHRGRHLQSGRVLLRVERAGGLGHPLLDRVHDAADGPVGVLEAPLEL